MIGHTCTTPIPRMEEMLLSGIEKDLVDDMLRSLTRPGAVIEEVTAGPKFIAVIAGGRMGLASLLGARPSEGEAGITERAVGRTVAEVAGYLLRPSPFAVCLGMAALNASNTPDPSGPVGEGASAEELITELGQGRQVGLVGEFPFVDALRSKAGSLHLFELRDGPHAVPRDRWDDVLPGLDVLAVTGTALLTRQMGYFLSRARKAVSVVLGPTTPLSRALFRFGADYLCGSVVIDPCRVLEGVKAGLPFRAVKKGGGIRFFTWSRED